MGKQRKISEKSLANLIPFKPGESGNPKGRSKKIYTILKEKGFGADDIKTTFRELIFYSLPELKEVFENDNNPVILRIVARQLSSALARADWGKIKEIIEYTMGKPSQEMNLNARVETKDMDFYDYYILSQNGNGAGIKESGIKSDSSESR